MIIHNISDAHVDHILEGLVQVVADFLDFHLLGEKIFLNLIFRHDCDDQKIGGVYF